MKQLKLEYVETIPAKCAKIESLLARGAREELETEFHKMKGTGKTYGLGEVSQLGEVLEALAMSQVALNEFVDLGKKLFNDIYESQKAGREFMIETSDDFKKLKAKL